MIEENKEGQLEWSMFWTSFKSLLHCAANIFAHVPSRFVRKNVLFYRVFMSYYVYTSMMDSCVIKIVSWVHLKQWYWFMSAY